MKTKKTIAILLIAVMLMTSITAYADKTIGQNALDIIKNQLEVMRLQAQNAQSFVAIIKDLIPLMLEKFKDVKETDWYKDNLALLFGLNVVEGNEKGDFMPNDTLTGSQYLKMVVVALDNKNYAAVNGEWDKPYIDRALQLGLVEAGEISKYSDPLNRYNMARIIVRACKEEYGNYKQYQNNIKDYSKIPLEFKDFVLKAYSKGLINGYTDGTFKGDETMRRSEATAVIARLIDPSQRVEPKKAEQPKIDNDLIDVPLTSEAQVEICPENDPQKVDFMFLFLMYKPIEPQYTDAENLLTARFGKGNAAVKEIMTYVKSKDARDKELAEKRWVINGQTIRVSSKPNAMYTGLTVWRIVK